MNEPNPILAFTNTQNIDYYNGVIGSFVFKETQPVVYSSYNYAENGVLYCASATEKGVTGGGGSGGGQHRAVTDSMYYIHTDHLGSYCAITSPSKQVVQREHFDPWGNYRLIIRSKGTDEVREDSIGIGTLPTLNFTLTHRGFTGHEHYPYFKIINMNGRLYDPVIARFFSPDKYVANSTFTQDFNRYSYARNCPLMYTDPEGELLWFAPLIAIAVSAAISAASYTIQAAVAPGGLSQNWNGMNFFAATFMGAWSGAATAGIGGVIGGVSMTTGMGILKELGRAGAHATVSGLTSMAGEGKFWQGAATGAISSFTGSLTHNLPIAAQIGASTIAGGITSKISGGEFWKGAVTGFTVSAFNHTMHGIENTVEANQYVKSARAFLEDLGFPADQVKQDVVRHPSAFWGKKYAQLNNFNSYKDAFTSGHFDSHSFRWNAWQSSTREINVEGQMQGYALKYYPSRDNSIGIIRTGISHTIEAGYELWDAGFRFISGRDNVIYDMHGCNATLYLYYR